MSTTTNTATVAQMTRKVRYLASKIGQGRAYGWATRQFEERMECTLEQMAELVGDEAVALQRDDLAREREEARIGELAWIADDDPVEDADAEDAAIDAYLTRNRAGATW